MHAFLMEFMTISVYMLTLLATSYLSNATTYCPLRFPYAYNGGQHCCKYNEEKSNYEFRGSYADEYCNGGALSLDSQCCKDDQYNICPGVTCATADFENDPCSEDFPYPYYHGLYCCKTAQEKVTFASRPSGSACQNGALTLTSECCNNNEYTECVNPPCVTMDYWSLTWNAEGNDNENDADFSRKLRVSVRGGVKVGKGYDMTSVLDIFAKQTLQSAGLTDEDATTISGGGYISGSAAQTFVANNQGITITHKQQWELFKLTRDAQLGMIRSTLSGLTPPVTDFDALHSSIKGLLLDLQITGEYVNPLSQTIHTWVSTNDVAGLASYVGESTNWPSVPQERFNLRKAYMEKAVSLL